MNIDLDPKFYGARHHHRVELTLKSLLKYCKKGRVLDAGIGNGNLSMRLAKLGFDVYGIDLADKFVNFVKEELKKNYEKINVKRGDILDIPFKENYFDIIVCAEVLEYALQEDYKAVAEFYRVLKPNGFCVVSVPVNSKSTEVNDEWEGHYKKYTKQGLKNLFLENKFKIIETKEWGFLLIKLFHNMVFKPLARRRMNNKNMRLHKSKIAKIINQFLVLLFSFDKCFSFTENSGLILVARK